MLSNWAQYCLVMKYLTDMTETQTLVMYSGHPLGNPILSFLFNFSQLSRPFPFRKELSTSRHLEWHDDP